MMGKKRKKGKINEDDTIKTMSRYGATTILTLLQEVAQSADVKIDWKTIVKRSSTGISNPREYQMLWRHLAYHEPLLEEIDGAEPTRWCALKKRRLATSNTNWSSNSINLANSGVLDAARLALNNALGKPMARSYSLTNAGPTQSVTPPKIINPFSPIVPEALRRPSPPEKPSLLQETKRTVQEASDILQETPNQAAPEKGNVIPSSKPLSTPKRPPIITTSSLIKAAAFAAGGRIVAPSAAASLLQSLQSKNIIHIRAGGSHLTPTVSRGRQPANASSPLAFRMPPPSGNSLMMSNRSTVPSHKQQCSSKITVKGPATGAQQSSSSPANAEKMRGKKTSASNGDGGLSTGMAEGAGATKSDSVVLNQDQKKSLEAGEKDSRTEKDVNITV